VLNWDIEVRDLSAYGKVVRLRKKVKIDTAYEKGRDMFRVWDGDRCVEQLGDWSFNLDRASFVVTGTSWFKRRGSTVYPRLEFRIRPNLHDELAKIFAEPKAG
jgi:hypothetical protein